MLASVCTPHPDDPRPLYHLSLCEGWGRDQMCGVPLHGGVLRPQAWQRLANQSQKTKTEQRLHALRQEKEAAELVRSTRDHSQPAVAFKSAGCACAMAGASTGGSSRSGLGMAAPACAWHRACSSQPAAAAPVASQDGCTFKPAINKRSDTLMSERSETLKALKLSAHAQLYQDAVRRQIKCVMSGWGRVHKGDEGRAP